MLHDGECIVQNVLLGANADLVVHPSSVQSQVLVLEHHPTAGGFKLPYDHLDRRCLASSVVAKESKDLTSVHLYVEVIDSFDFGTVGLGQTLDPQHVARLPLLRILSTTYALKVAEIFQLSVLFKVRSEVALLPPHFSLSHLDSKAEAGVLSEAT